MPPNLLQADRVEEKVFPSRCLHVGIMSDFVNVEDFSCEFEKAKVCASTPLKAEVAHRFRAQELLQRRNQEGKCWLKVHTVGSKHYRWMGWDVTWKWLTPIQSRCHHD